MLDLSFPSGHHCPALRTLNLETGYSLLMRYLFTAGRADAKSPGAGARTAATPSSLTAASPSARTLTPIKTWHFVSSFQLAILLLLVLPLLRYILGKNC
jgi:hypothetical protein